MPGKQNAEERHAYWRFRYDNDVTPGTRSYAVAGRKLAYYMCHDLTPASMREAARVLEQTAAAVEQAQREADASE